ncbi:MAG: alpha/beta hydrolase, partial [Burkholderiales bacterium]|nr:alpha/beta hydrolase [Burkholderiales bacterium]
IVRPPAGVTPSATLVYFHGGGWIVGDLDSHEAHAMRIANRSGAVVVMVDYRLAPEHPFPAGYEDCLAATLWASAQRAELGGASRPLALGGDSAGGNFAAAVALACRDAGIAVAVQLLLYPATDLAGDPNAEVMRAYIPKDAERVMRDPRASPARADLAGVAPVIMGVGPHDFLYQDNLAFAAKLRAAGVALTLRQFPTLNHGFFSYTAISADCAAAAELLCEDLRRALTTAA